MDLYDDNVNRNGCELVSMVSGADKGDKSNMKTVEGFS
jgi:hypothetical protein